MRRTPLINFARLVTRLRQPTSAARRSSNGIVHKAIIPNWNTIRDQAQNTAATLFIGLSAYVLLNENIPRPCIRDALDPARAADLSHAIYEGQADGIDGRNHPNLFGINGKHYYSKQPDATKLAKEILIGTLAHKTLGKHAPSVMLSQDHTSAIAKIWEFFGFKQQTKLGLLSEDIGDTENLQRWIERANKNLAEVPAIELTGLGVWTAFKGLIGETDPTARNYVISHNHSSVHVYGIDHELASTHFKNMIDLSLPPAEAAKKFVTEQGAITEFKTVRSVKDFMRQDDTLHRDEKIDYQPAILRKIEDSIEKEIPDIIQFFEKIENLTDTQLVEIAASIEPIYEKGSRNYNDHLQWLKDIRGRAKQALEKVSNTKPSLGR